jgi:hypothetical protein
LVLHLPKANPLMTQDSAGKYVLSFELDVSVLPYLADNELVTTFVLSPVLGV